MWVWSRARNLVSLDPFIGPGEVGEAKRGERAKCIIQANSTSLGPRQEGPTRYRTHIIQITSISSLLAPPAPGSRTGLWFLVSCDASRPAGMKMGITHLDQITKTFTRVCVESPCSLLDRA